MLNKSKGIIQRVTASFHVPFSCHKCCYIVLCHYIIVCALRVLCAWVPLYALDCVLVLILVVKGRQGLSVSAASTWRMAPLDNRTHDMVAAVGSRGPHHTRPWIQGGNMLLRPASTQDTRHLGCQEVETNQTSQGQLLSGERTEWEVASCPGSTPSNRCWRGDVRSPHLSGQARVTNDNRHVGTLKPVIQLINIGINLITDGARGRGKYLVVNA